MPLMTFARRFRWFLVVALCLVAARGAWATDYHWTGAGTGGSTATDPSDPTTQWAGAANWQEGSAPDASAAVYLPLANTGSVYAATAIIDTLCVDGSAASGVLSITDGVTLTVNTTMYVGKTQSGKTVQSGGTCQVEGYLYLGNDANSSGVYELSGAAVLNTATSGLPHAEYIGYSGTGAFTQTGGTHTVSGVLCLGYNSGASGTYNLSLGDLNALSDEYIGYYGTGTFTQTGGTHTVNGNLYVTVWDATGTYGLSSGDLNAKSNEIIGYSGAGTFTQTGGTHTVNATLYLGYIWGGSGIYHFSSGVLNDKSDEYIGYRGTGTFAQTGGTHTVNGALCLGFDSGASGTYDLSLGALNATADEYIGYSGAGAGTFTQTGGTHTVTGSLYVGVWDATGTYALGPGDLDVKSDEVIGYFGTGTFTQTGGAHTVTSLVKLGSNSAGVGTYEMGGGTLTVPTINVGVAGQGIFHWTGGTLNVQDIEIGGKNSRFSVGQTAQFAGKLHANGGAVEVDLGDTLTLLGEFGTTQDGKTVTKDGAGALRIQGPQVYATGAILSVAEGTVFMDTAAGDATTQNLEVDVGGAGSDALVVFEADEYLKTLHILSGGTVRLGVGCQVVVLDTLWIDGFGEFQNITWTNAPEPATLALVAFGALAAWARRVKTPRKCAPGC